MTSRTMWGAALGVLALAGCSSGGGFGGSHDSYDDRYQAMVDNHAAEGYTDPSSLPHSGGVEYVGVANMSIGTEDVMGRMRLSFRFGSSGDPVSGSIGNFRSADNTALDGKFTISDGEIYRDVDPYDTYTYFSHLTGSIMLPEHSELEGPAGAVFNEYEMSWGSVNGDFLGNGGAVAGRIEGDLFNPGRGFANLNGTFIAER